MKKPQTLPKIETQSAVKYSHKSLLKRHLRFYQNLHTPAKFAHAKAIIAEYFRLLISESKFMIIRPKNAPKEKTIWVNYRSNFLSQYKCRSDVMVK